MINAFIYDATVLEYLASIDDGCKLRTVSTWNAKTGYGIGFPKGSKWIKSVNKLIINFQHTGELARDDHCHSGAQTLFLRGGGPLYC